MRAQTKLDYRNGFGTMCTSKCNELQAMRLREAAQNVVENTWSLRPMEFSNTEARLDASDHVHRCTNSASKQTEAENSGIYV